jgi:hypothetical protein
MRRIIVVSIYENDLSRTGHGSLSSTAKCKSTATLLINLRSQAAYTVWHHENIDYGVICSDAMIVGEGVSL